MRKVLFVLVALMGAGTVWAASDPIGAPTPLGPAVEKSTNPATTTMSDGTVIVTTTPVGSPYYRHLAYDFDFPIKELAKFERKGFGRIEIVELILIATAEEKPIKELGNRRIKDHVSMDTLVKEAGLNYNEVMKVAREIKLDIEARGDKDLPPAVYDVGASTAAAAADVKAARSSKKTKAKEPEKKP